MQIFIHTQLAIHLHDILWQLIIFCRERVLNRHPLDYQSNAITTTPTAVYIVKFWRDQVDSAYIHIVIVITQREQKRLNYIRVWLSILRIIDSIDRWLPRVGLNHYTLSYHSYAITTTPTAALNCKSRRDQMDRAYIYIVMFSKKKEKRVHYLKPGVSNVR